jgi:alkanesulfonate monooxygenase SsuD/methylene tetrahydromethanopterin reductase-like flavin-dependent oxidoreductase (luciferase family)
MAETGERMKIGVMPSLGENDYGAEAPNGRTPRFSDITAMAQLAEDIGVDSFWLADHLLYHMPDEPVSGQWEVFTFMSGVAAVTKRIQIGPLVACTSFRSPALLAKMADALDEISEGRFILGLGAGWHQPEYDTFGYPFDHKASRFEEALKIILPLLQEGKVDFKGEYYEARECELHPRGPSPKGPPIWIGAHRPRMLRLIAQHADAFNTVWHYTPDAVEKAYQPMLEACKEVGRDPTTLELTAGTFARVLAPGEQRPDDIKSMCGEPEEVAEAILGFERIGVKHLVVIVSPEDIHGVERFGKVIEALRKA